MAVPSNELERIAKAANCRICVGPDGWSLLDSQLAPTNPNRDEATSLAEQWKRALPLVGQASAGDGGCFLDEAGVTWFSLDDAWSRRLDGLVYVKGDSMAPMLDDGDLVGLRRVDDLLDGDVVVVQDLRADVLHIKVWEPADDDRTVVLRSVNPAHRNLTLSAGDVQILGVAYGLLRLRKLRVR